MGKVPSGANGVAVKSMSITPVDGEGFGVIVAVRPLGKVVRMVTAICCGFPEVCTTSNESVSV